MHLSQNQNQPKPNVKSLSSCAIMLHNGWPPYLHDLQESLLRRGVRGLQDPPDVLGFIQGHLQQVSQHHQLLQLGLRLRGQFEHWRLQAARYQGGLPGLLPGRAHIWNANFSMRPWRHSFQTQSNGRKLSQWLCPHFAHRTWRLTSRRVQRRRKAWRPATCDWPPPQTSRESPHRRIGKASPHRGPAAQIDAPRGENKKSRSIKGILNSITSCRPRVPSCHNRKSPWCPRLSPSPRHRSPQTGEAMRLCWNLTAEKSGCAPEEGQWYTNIFNISDVSYIDFVTNHLDFFHSPCM